MPYQTLFGRPGGLLSIGLSRAAVFSAFSRVAGYRPCRSLLHVLQGVLAIAFLCLAGGEAFAVEGAAPIARAAGGAAPQISTAAVHAASPALVPVSIASVLAGISVSTACAEAASPAVGAGTDPAPDQLPDAAGLFQALSGNVGIGTKKPRAKLEVRGDLLVTGELRVEGRGRKDRECRRIAFDASGAAVCGDGFSVAGVWKADKGEAGGAICCR